MGIRSFRKKKKFALPGKTVDTSDLFVVTYLMERRRLPTEQNMDRKIAPGELTPAWRRRGMRKLSGKRTGS